MPKGDNITPKQKAFADRYLETGNATEAANQAYDVKNRNVANNIGSENLAKPSVRAYLEQNAEVYKNKIQELMITADKHETQLSAAKYLMDQAIGKAEQRNSNKNENTGDITINLTDYSK